MHRNPTSRYQIPRERERERERGALHSIWLIRNTSKVKVAFNAADNPDPEMVVPSSALLDPWNDSYSGESRKMVEEQEERQQNQIQRRQGQRFGRSLSFDLEIH